MNTVFSTDDQSYCAATLTGTSNKLLKSKAQMASRPLDQSGLFPNAFRYLDRILDVVNKTPPGLLPIHLLVPQLAQNCGPSCSHI